MFKRKPKHKWEFTIRYTYDHATQIVEASSIEKSHSHLYLYNIEGDLVYMGQLGYILSVCTKQVE